MCAAVSDATFAICGYVEESPFVYWKNYYQYYSVYSEALLRKATPFSVQQHPLCTATPFCVQQHPFVYSNTLLCAQAQSTCNHVVHTPLAHHNTITPHHHHNTTPSQHHTSADTLDDAGVKYTGGQRLPCNSWCSRVYTCARVSGSSAVSG